MDTPKSALAAFREDDVHQSGRGEPDHRISHLDGRRMLLVQELDGERVVKHAENFGEMNSVLAPVFLGLVVVPFKR
jgi:hypothetical protein